MKVFLGGTCNGSNWRDLIIPHLKMDYYNPVVDDWTPDCILEEMRQKTICNICLYVITPKMSGVYSIAEVVDDSNKRPGKTLLCVLPDDDGIEFNEGQHRSLMAVIDMVKRNGVKVFTSLEETVSHINWLSKASWCNDAEYRLTENFIL